MDYKRFDKYVEAHSSEYVRQLMQLCEIASISAEGGPNMTRAAEHVADLCRQSGLTPQIVQMPNGPPVVMASGGAGARSLMLYDHYDVQPPDPLDEWVSPPFAPVIRGGLLYARGVSDNKGNLVARLAAAEAYLATVGPLPLRLLLVADGEEEVGSPHLGWFAERHEALLRQMDGCIWEAGYKDPAGRPVLSLGVKGILAVEIDVRTASTDAHSGYGGIYPNAAWRLVEALGTLRAPDGRVTVDGFAEQVRPPTSDELALLETLPFHAGAILEANGMRQFLGGLTGIGALQRLLFEPTCTINGFHSGYGGPGNKTVIPCHAVAKLDFRLVPELSPTLAARLLREHLDRRGFDDIRMGETVEGLMPARTDPSAPVAQAAVSAMANLYGAPPVVYPTIAGSGPMYELCQRYGIPAVSLGVGWSGSRNHAPNENIRIEDYIEGIKVMGRVYGMFAETDPA